MSDDLQPLLDDLRSRRLKSQRHGDPISQPEIAEEVGVAASTISRYESGHRALGNLPGSKLYVFLKGYRYSDAEIRDIVERYGLSYPPELLGQPDGASTPPGMVYVMHEGSISRAEPPRPTRVLVDWLAGLAPADVRVRQVRDDDLATERAQGRARSGSRLVVQPGREPAAGNLVIVEQGGVQALVVWPLDIARHAAPYDPIAYDTPPVLLRPGQAHPVAVVITNTQREI